MLTEKLLALVFERGWLEDRALSRPQPIDGL
jgi:hypothetical protein